MIRDGDPFGRALASLRERLRAGVFGQGQPLAIVDIARDLDLSPTPVREALARLVGEGLIEDRRGRGFFSARLDANDLAELYDLEHLQLGFAVVSLATAERKGKTADVASLSPQNPAEESMADLATAAEMVLDRIIKASGRMALRSWHQALATRLGPARRVEARVLAGVEPEIRRLAALLDAGDWGELRGELRRFHRRRCSVANDVCATLRRRP